MAEISRGLSIVDVVKEEPSKLTTMLHQDTLILSGGKAMGAGIAFDIISEINRGDVAGKERVVRELENLANQQNRRLYKLVVAELGKHGYRVVEKR